MKSYRFLNLQVRINNNIKFISYLTENKQHINYEDYPLNTF
jgi:hypothetical protein